MFLFVSMLSMLFNVYKCYWDIKENLNIREKINKFDLYI
jgi:hypothetical protein